MENNISQSEDKLALDALKQEISDLEELIKYHQALFALDKSKLQRLKDQKIMRENYLNSDND